MIIRAIVGCTPIPTCSYEQNPYINTIGLQPVTGYTQLPPLRYNFPTKLRCHRLSSTPHLHEPSRFGMDWRVDWPMVHDMLVRKSGRMILEPDRSIGSSIIRIHKESKSYQTTMTMLLFITSNIPAAKNHKKKLN